jgi:hypothetical protein
MSELRTITAPFRKVGVFTIRDDGAELPKQAPAIVSPGAVRRITRARGEEQQIPQVEIYIDDQGLAGQEEAPERLVSKAMREAKKRIGSRKEVAEIEKALLQKKVEKEIAKEDVVEEIKNGVIKKTIKRKEVDATAMVPFVEDKGVEKAKLKLERQRLKTKEADAKAMSDMMAQAQNYFQYQSARVKELQKKEGISFKEGQKRASTEWKESHKPAGYITEKGEETSSSKKTIKSGRTATSEEKKSDTDLLRFPKPGEKGFLPTGGIPYKEGDPIPKGMMVAKFKSGELRLITKKNVDLKAEEEKAKELKLETSDIVKEAKVSKSKQKKIMEFVKGLDDDVLESEYRKIKTRGPLPSRTKMENALIKQAGGRTLPETKFKYTTDEDSR